jgi:hypothetical protein
VSDEYQQIVEIPDPGCRPNPTTKRGLVILRWGHKFANAYELLVLDQKGAKKTIKKQIVAAIRTWLQGVDKARKAHGWNKSQHNGKYVDCWVFKYETHRVYGFLNRNSVLRHQCVLVHYCAKTKNASDTSVLAKIVEFSSTPEVIAALKKFEKERGRR